VCLLRDLVDFIDACDIRATANASGELRQRPPGMRAKSSFEQIRSVGQYAQLTLAAMPIHCCRMLLFSSAATLGYWALGH
jgi:hypothetical protein